MFETVPAHGVVDHAASLSNFDVFIDIDHRRWMSSGVESVLDGSFDHSEYSLERSACTPGMPGRVPGWEIHPL